MRDLIKFVGSLAVAAASLSTTAVAGVAVPAPLPAPVAPEEIVVTATRSGLPVWRVKGPASTLILVGGIDGVAKGTRWNPASLTQALLQADRVMFPDTVHVTGSPFALLGYLAKWRKQATLPQGQSLVSMVPPHQFARLVALRNRGLIKPGFERKHPFHLAMALRNTAKGEGYGPDASDYVNQAVKKHKLKLVKGSTSKAKPIASEFFTRRPQAHIPCLMDAIDLAEAGPAAVKARSDAWAQRRVVDALGSRAEGVYQTCWPAGSIADITPAKGLRSVVRRMLNEQPTTVAVVSLESLALPGGVLDDLKAGGYDIVGPAWRR